MATGMLQAAFGKVRITPEETSPLQGYNPSEYIADPNKDNLDDLYARVLIVDDGMTRQAILSIDCCLSSEETFQAADPDGKMYVYRHLLNTFPVHTRKRWGEAAGVGEMNVSVHPTHTHSAPEHFGEKYTARVASMITDTAAQLRPARMKYVAGSCTIAANRRPNLKHNDTLPINSELQIVVFEAEDGVPIGGLANCAVHPTLQMNFYRLTTEFVGLAMNEWESQVGGDFVAMFIQGFSGDIGPIYHDRSETEDTYPKLLEYGQILYQDIAALLPRLIEVSALPIRCAEHKAALPTREGYFKNAIEMNLHALRLGEVVMLSASGEIFNGYIDLIKSRSPFDCMLFSGLSNGYKGYLPTYQAFQDGLGGYEINTTPYSDKACNLFIDSAVMLLEQLLNPTESK